MGESRADTGHLATSRRVVRRHRRVFVVLSALSTVLCYNLLSVEVATADPYWTSAIELPGLATLNQTTAVPGPIVCTSAGNCVSGGGYAGSSQDQQAFLSQETSGVWSKAVEIGAALNVGGYALVNGISCPSAGSCTAVGNYTDASGTEHSFVVSQTNGTWGFPTELPDFTTLSSQDASAISAVSCTSATQCVGVGTYLVNSTSIAQPITYSETNGVWATPAEAPGAASINPIGIALVTSLDCPSATTCVAGGAVATLTTPESLVPFLIEDNNGVWNSVEVVPGAAALSRIADAALISLSCGAVGDCVAGGFYYDVSGGSQAFVVSEVDGVWGNATQLFATQLLGSGLSNTLSGIDCPSAGNCAAVGGFADSDNVAQPFVVDETNHVWSPAIEVPGVQALNKSAGASLTTISCSAPGACSAGGSYTDSSGGTQPFLVNEASHSWSNPIEVPGAASLNRGGSATISQVSCSGDGSCGVQGLYTDASKNAQLFVTNSTTVAPTTVSSAPRHVTAVDNEGVITVRWSAPATNGGARVTSYTVVSLPKTKTCVTIATSCKFKGLNKKDRYAFEVRAVNKNGSSALSARSNAVRSS
ncbi:MAG TPA: fibronectin type III domain-containing protein [Acidimicrobiales bacterium]|nr:fibronectin type III domain-containing protein [Acidimicrobiales bacterium]